MVQFDVKAGAGSGFLLYAAEYPTEQTMSFLSLFMASWTLYFRFNVGNDVTKSISLPLPSHVMDQWISVEVGKNASLAWMTVDGRTTTADLSQVSLRQLRIFTHLYVGGVPSSIRTAPSAAVAGLSSFDGCIAALSINKRALAVAEALGGLNVADCQGERCASARCTSLADGVGGWPLTVQPEGPSFVTIAEPRYQQVKRTLSYLSLSFRTGQSDGMLIWTGKVVNSHSDYLGLGLVGGYMQVVLNLGWQSKRALLSPPPQRYDDNSWHHMIFSREGSNLSLIMDASSFLNANVFVPGSYKELDTDGLYHLGSFPSGLSLYQETLGYFSRPFTGCISNVTFAADTPLQPLSSSPFDNIQPFTRCFN
ncbi:hypothetical protein RvY_13953 [Ramazzottius varieornatus]|uniref:Laminin G domain-containing protein n=1 Tax=Ramazzottius varieornatus TaxID=947166 RepID=A0A1D1VPR6_RAMVA|nr:hypothetical protein RvY_13953 [Ramazzottius varieornatus]